MNKPLSTPLLLTGLMALGATTVPVWAQSIQTAGNIQTEGQVVSTATTGTAPLQVSSTTVVPNLNADQVDGLEGTDLAASIAALQARTIPINLGAIDLDYTGASSRPSKALLGGFTHPVLAFANNVNNQVNVSVPIPADYTPSSNFQVRVLFSTPTASATVRWLVTIGHLVPGQDAGTTGSGGFTLIANASPTAGGLSEVSFLFQPPAADALATHVSVQRRDDLQPNDTADTVYLHGITVTYN